MIARFNLQFNLPSRNYFSRVAIPTLYAEAKSEIQQNISIGGTTDLWSSITHEPYLSYTMHYIDREWKLQAKCL